MEKDHFWAMILSMGELILSAVVHLLVGFYIFSTAVAWDITKTISEFVGLKIENTPTAVKEKKDEDDAKEKPLDGSVPPIVLVHGIFGFGKGKLGGLSYFGGAENKDKHVLVPDLGSLTSLHDRACELFYYLKGGQVDFGEEHSRTCGHSRYGKIYKQGNYPAWDENHPIHFVGHSAGAQVIRVLQQMLADKAFGDHENTSADWILSVTSLSGPLNGTTRTYLDGMQTDNWRFMKPVCLLQVLRIGVILYDWLDIAWMKEYYNFGFDHYEMGWRKTGLSGLIDLLLGYTGPFASGDWVVPDLTIQGSQKLNSKIQTFPKTYYFSYATTKARLAKNATSLSSLLGIHPLLIIRVLQMRQWRYPADLPLPFKSYRDEDWEENDGAVNTISMTYPRVPKEHPSQFFMEDSDCHPMRPGIWYYKIVEADHVLFIVNRERGGELFDVVYDSIFNRCRKIVSKTASLLPKQYC